MSSTNFTPGVVVNSAWLNDVDNATYNTTPTNTAAITAETSRAETAEGLRPTSTTLAASSGSSLLGTIQSGTGAVLRTQAQKNSENINIQDFGAKCDNITDDTASLNAALLALYNAGGGTLVIPNKKCLIAGQIILPNDNTAASTPNPYSRQPNIRITGYGDVRNGQGQIPGATYGGSVLRLTYNGTNAKIMTFGLGLLEVDHLTLWDDSGSSLPFFLTTGTTCNIHDNSFIGSKSGLTCDQDVLIFGGINPTFTTINDPTAAYQGYNSNVQNNYFNYIRRAIFAQVYVASLYVSHNFIGPGCGTNIVNGSAMEFNSASVGNNTIDNIIVFNRFEITSYYYGIRFIGSQNNYIAGNDFEDNLTAIFQSLYYFDSNSGFNNVSINVAPNGASMTYLTHVTDLTISDTYPHGLNTILDSTQNAPSFLGYWNKKIK